MAETSIDDLKAGLRQLIDHPPRGWGDFSLSRSREFKDLTAKAQRLLAQSKPAPATLRQVTAQIKQFY